MADKTARPDFNEIATTLDGRDITRGYVLPQILLLPQDEVLTTRGGNDLRSYEDLLRDDQVAAAFHQRRLATVSAPIDIQPGGKRAIDKKAADSLRAQIEALSMDDITDKMMYGLFYGYSVGECLWGRDGREIVLDDIKVRKTRRFRFDGELRLRMLTYADLMGELLPERKFWQFAAGADNSDEPYGLGLGHYVWWPVFFKRNGMRFWLIFLEKFGQPTAHGQYPPGATEDEQAKLLAAVQAIQTDSGVITPEGMPISLIEAARSGTADYATMNKTMNESISKVIMGQTMTADNGGSRAAAQIHMEVRQDIVRADAAVISDSFNNQVAAWLTAWNYPGAATPKMSRKVEETWRDTQAIANRDKALGTLGYRPTLKYVQDTYGGEWEDTGMPAAAGATPGPLNASQTTAAAFAENPPPTVTDRQAMQLDGDIAPALGHWIDAIRQLVEQSDSLEQVRDGLLDLYPQMSLDDYAAAMQQALSAANLAGRSDILDQANSGA